MKIAFVTPEYVTEKSFDGGLANHLGRVCPELAAMGHEVHVIVASETEGTFYKNGVTVHRVLVSPRKIKWSSRVTLGRLPSASLWLLQSWSLKHACEKLHRQNPFHLIQYASYAATGFFRLKDVPAVVRISSYEPLWQNAYRLEPSPDCRLMSWLDKAAIRKADALFGPSRLIAKLVEQDAGRLVKVIEPPFFLEHAEWDAQPYRQLLAGKKFLLFFGTLGLLKGVATIAQVINTLLQEHSDLYFVFIGKDGGYLGLPMMQHVWEKAGPCRGRVLYLGQMRHFQLHPILCHATAVVLPSLIDNLPNSCLEAMALKRVVIGTRGASFEQLIEDGWSGFLCEPDSPESLLATLKRALALSEQERTGMGERAAFRIAGLSPEISLARLLDFYRSILQGEGGIVRRIAEVKAAA